MIPAENPIDAFQPKIGKNYINPYLFKVPTGTVYEPIKTKRPVILIPLSPTTTGTVYIISGRAPSNDTMSIPIQQGNYIVLDGIGKWYVRTSSAAEETFRVIDAGGAGNLSGILAALGLPTPTTTLNRSSWSTGSKTVAVPSTAEQLGSLAIPNGFALTIQAPASNTGNVGIGQSAAAADLVTGTPIVLGPGASARLYVTNANLVYVDAIVANEGVRFAAEQ